MNMNKSVHSLMYSLNS